MRMIQFLILSFVSIVVFLGCGVTNENEGVIKIKNSISSNTDIKDIYIRRSKTTDWGNDKLDSEELEAGESKQYTLDKCNRDYDFKVIYLNNNYAINKDIYIACYTKRVLVFKD